MMTAMFGVRLRSLALLGLAFTIGCRSEPSADDDDTASTSETSTGDGDGDHEPDAWPDQLGENSASDAADHTRAPMRR